MPYPAGILCPWTITLEAGDLYGPKTMAWHRDRSWRSSRRRASVWSVGMPSLGRQHSIFMGNRVLETKQLSVLVALGSHRLIIKLVLGSEWYMKRLPSLISRLTHSGWPGARRCILSQYSLPYWMATVRRLYDKWSFPLSCLFRNCRTVNSLLK